MGENKGRKVTLLHVILGILVVGWSFVIAPEGFNVDENGLLSIYKGIYQGQRMFVDAWGPMQMGGLLTYPLFALYHQVLQPLIYPLGVGFVLYMRYAYLLVRFVIAAFLYATIRKTDYRDSAFVVSLVYFMMVISFKNFSYKSFCDFAFILIICFGIRYIITSNKINFVMMALATCMGIIAYPTMIIFPVVFVICMFILSYKGYTVMLPTMFYTVTCFVCGIAMVLYLQFTVGLENIIPQLKFLEDSDFEGPVYERIGMLLLSYAVLFVIAYLPIFIVWLLRFKANISEQMEHLILGIYWIAFMAAICLFRDDSISLSRFVYGCIILFFWCPYLASRKDVSGYTTIGHYNQPQFCGDECLTFMFAVSVLAQVIWGISTNQGVSIPGNVAYYAVLAVIMVVYDENYGLKLLEYGILLASIVFSCFWVMEDNGGFHHVMEQRYIAPEGAYKGVALSATDYTMTQTCYSILSENVSEDDYLLVAFGAYSNGYLDSDAHQAAGSAYTRTHINDKLLQYWQLNPENQADYVLIDTNCGRYEKYVDSVCAQYINENYTREIANQNGIILLGR